MAGIEINSIVQMIIILIGAALMFYFITEFELSNIVNIIVMTVRAIVRGN